MADFQKAPIDSTVPTIWVRYYQAIRDRLNFLTKTTKRVTTTPYSVINSDTVLFIDTDSSAITVNLTPGTDVKEYIIKNVGTSGNDVTIVPSGSETIENNTVTDGNSEHIMFTSTDGWKNIGG